MKENEEKSMVKAQISLADLYARSGDIIRRVHYSGESVIVTGSRKPLAEIRPVADPRAPVQKGAAVK